MRVPQLLTRAPEAVLQHVYAASLQSQSLRVNAATRSWITTAANSAFQAHYEAG